MSTQASVSYASSSADGLVPVDQSVSLRRGAPKMSPTRLFFTIELVAAIAMMIIAIVAIVLVSVYAPVLAVGVVIAVKVIGSLFIISSFYYIVRDSIMLSKK